MARHGKAQAAIQAKVRGGVMFNVVVRSGYTVLALTMGP